MSGFTKGPWNLTASARLLNQWGVGDDLYLGAVCSDGFPVCIVVLDGLERTEAKANADMLAAAPDLYETLASEALNELLGMVEDSGDTAMWYVAVRFMELRDAALSKAAGEGV